MSVLLFELVELPQSGLKPIDAGLKWKTLVVHISTFYSFLTHFFFFFYFCLLSEFLDHCCNSAGGGLLRQRSDIRRGDGTDEGNGQVHTQVDREDLILQMKLTALLNHNECHMNVIHNPNNCVTLFQLTQLECTKTLINAPGLMRQERRILFTCKHDENNVGFKLVLSYCFQSCHPSPKRTPFLNFKPEPRGVTNIFKLD